MTDFQKLCLELLDELQYQTDWSIAEELKERTLTALAEPEPEGPTDEELLEAVKAGVASFPPRHPEALNLSAVEYEVELEIRKARAVLARWGNHSAPQPIPVSERVQQIEDLAADAVCGLRYIERQHGRLYGVGWDRVYAKAERLLSANALPQPW